jgi:hypothetical protein
MPENEAEPWEYTLYIPNDLRTVTVSRRTLRLKGPEHEWGGFLRPPHAHRPNTSFPRK